jgi:hypothetical protein
MVLLGGGWWGWGCGGWARRQRGWLGGEMVGGGASIFVFFDINVFQDDICSIFFRDVCYICVLLNYSAGLKDDDNKMLED